MPAMCMKPLHERTETFCVRAAEAGSDNRATVPAVCGFLQEIAGNHADALHVGIQTLQENGRTWMLARLRMEILRHARWRERVTVRTWPSGTSGRLTALRDFEATDDAGAPLLRASSEWLYVDARAQRILRLPPGIAALAPEGGPRAALPPMPEKWGGWPGAAWSCEVAVRRSDEDFNRHVNNVHYAEWAIEPLPDEWVAARAVRLLDIRFRQAARHGDRVRCEAAPEAGGGAALLHRIVRLPDGAVLAQARTVWEAV